MTPNIYYLQLLLFAIKVNERGPHTDKKKREKKQKNDGADYSLFLYFLSKRLGHTQRTKCILLSLQALPV